MKTICVILAGGASRRMGRDKAQLTMGGETFLARLAGEYAPAFPVYVSVAAPGRRLPEGTAELVDRHPGWGPLAGLEAAFLETDAQAVFLTAVDLPFGTRALARRLLDLMGEADACVIRRREGGIEPAFGVYRRCCGEKAAALLQAGRRAFSGLMDQVKVRWVSEEELAEFPLGRLLQNINTPEAYENAMEFAENNKESVVGLQL